MCVKSKKNTTKAKRQLLFQSAHAYTAETMEKYEQTRCSFLCELRILRLHIVWEFLESGWAGEQNQFSFQYFMESCSFFYKLETTQA